MCWVDRSHSKHSENACCGLLDDIRFYEKWRVMHSNKVALLAAATQKEIAATVIPKLRTELSPQTAFEPRTEPQNGSGCFLKSDDYHFYSYLCTSHLGCQPIPPKSPATTPTPPKSPLSAGIHTQSSHQTPARRSVRTNTGS